MECEDGASLYFTMGCCLLQVEILIAAAPVSKGQHLLVRCGVLGACFTVICLQTAAIAAIFYGVFFGYFRFMPYLIPTIFIAAPCFMLPAGIGNLLGSMHQGLVYVAVLGIFAIGFGAWANSFDFFWAAYFSAYPMALGPGKGGEPAYVMEPEWIAARFLYLAAGALLVAWGVKRAGRKSTKA